MRKNTNFRKLIILAIAAVMCLSAVTVVNAAFIEVGTGTSASWYPSYGYYDYSYHGCIYMQSDIGAAIDINQISYDIEDYSGYTNTEYTIYNQQIYMTHTTLTTFPDATPFDPGTMTLVYDGDVHWSGTGWNTIPLDTEFSYNGVDNLIVYWENHDGDYDTGDPDFYYTYTSYTAKYGYGDGSFPTSGYRSGYQPNIRFHFSTDHDVAVVNIISPEPFEGTGNVPVSVKVKNVGLNTETFPVNVQILAPPVTLWEEGFEDLYSVRPNPPLGWLIKDNNLDGDPYSTYNNDMWGTYYSSSYSHTGTMVMRYEDGTYSGYGDGIHADDWLFTNATTFTSGQNYALDFWYATSSSTTTYHNNISLYIGTTQDNTGMTTLLWQDIEFVHYYYSDYGFASVAFTVPTTGTYYLGWHVHSSDNDHDIFLDDIHLYIPGGAVYDQTVTMTNIDPGVSTIATLPDWNVATPGEYTVVATTLLGTDEYAGDNQKTQSCQVGVCDAAFVSIDVPTTYMGPFPFTPQVTVTNPGTLDFTTSGNGLLPVHAFVEHPGGGTGTVFTEDFEGVMNFNEFSGEVSSEKIDLNNPIYKSGDFVGGTTTLLWPDDEPNLGDPADWTILNNDNDADHWHPTTYRYISADHSMYHGDEATHTYDTSWYSDDWMISPQFYIGPAGGSLAFNWYKDTTDAGYDELLFGASADGISWSMYWYPYYLTPGWYTFSGVPISSANVDANGYTYLAFVFQSDNYYGSGEGHYVDDVVVTGSNLLYDETMYVSLPAGGTTQVSFPDFERDPAYDNYVFEVCCEHQEDSNPANNCGNIAFNANAPVWNDRTGAGFGTIQAAIDDANTLDGDTIMVNNGNFNENIIINKGITVSGLTEPDCMVGYSYLFGTVDIVADDVILENLYVHPLEFFNHSQAAIAIYSNNVIVRHNTVEIQGATSGTIKGIHAYATPSEFTRNIEISDNCVHDVINCAGGGGGGDTYSFDFEDNDGGWIPDTTVGDWEWTNTYDVTLFVPESYTCEPPTTAHSGTGMWGTVMYGPYSNSGSETTLTHEFDFSGMTDVIMSFWEWSDLFGTWDYGEVFVNGVQEYYVDVYHPGCYWHEVMLDLSDYDDMSNVEIVFSVHASTVVNYAGWYIDDIEISSAKDRYGDGGDRATVTLVDEDFEGSFPPADWTVVDNLASCDWERNDYYGRTNYLDGAYSACADEDYCWSPMDTELITPTFSLDGMTSATLDFLNYFHSYSYYDQIGTVDISTNGGSTWTTLDTYTLADYIDPVSLSLDAYVGETNCQIRFHFISYDWAYYWEVDNVVITAEEEEEPGPEPSGPGGAVGIMDQGATWNVDILNNTVYDVHSTGWAYGIEVTPTALDPVTQHFEAYLDFEEDFTGVATGGIPTGWTRTDTHWGAYASSNSGGVSPEMRFYWSPSATDDFYLTTPQIDTSDFTTLDFEFKHYLSDYNSQYSLRVVALEGGNEHIIEEWISPSGWTATTETYTLTSADGVGASDFQLAWVFSGNSFNVNYWYVDDVILHGSYSYDETVYPWPLDVNIDGNHLSRINLGEGYPCPDDPMYPGVMLTVNYATLPTGGPTPADASEVIAHNNWFDRECFTQCIAILNTDLMHCLDATDNYYSAPDGPGSYNNSAVLDCMTNEPADGQGTQIVNYGPVAFDPWLGLNAVHNQPDIIYATTGESIFFDGSASWANPGDISFYWKFDDGYYSMEPSIAHTYSSPGTYNGYLRVHNLGIPLFNIPPLYEWDYFTVIVTGAGAPLSANAGGGSLGHYEISISEPLVLSGLASGGTQPYTYSWDLGDGRTVNGQNPIVKYQTEGTYTLTLTVIDANYDVATDTAILSVLGPEELSVSINSPANAGLGQYVTFESIVAGGTAPYTYTWNFGDGITSTLKKPAHIYENEGTYTVTLTVTDDVGQEKTTTTTIEIVGESTGQDPQIKSVKGLFGVKATIAAGDNDCTWSINVDGKYVFSGGQASGTIPANMEQTVKIPLTLALGKTTVTVTAGSITQQYTAFALGPLFLNLK